MSTIDLKEIKFKELSAAVTALNKSECFKDKEKIQIVGISKIELVESFLKAVESVPDDEKGEWTGPKEAGDYYNKIVVVEEAEVVEVIEKEVIEETTEIEVEVDKIAEDKEIKGVEKHSDAAKEKKVLGKGKKKKSRFDVAIEIIDKLPKGATKKEWVDLANFNYNKTGGKDNKSEFIWAIGIIIEILNKFDLIETKQTGEVVFKRN